VGAAADLAMALDRVVFARGALGLEPDGGGRLGCCDGLEGGS
jgi:hypothetical protein